MSSRRVRHRASLKSERLGNETLSTLLGRPSHSLVRTLPPMPPLPLAASCAHLFIPELVLKRRPRQLPDACASHWQCDPNDCGLPVLGTDASTEAAAAAAAPTEATCARHRRHATVRMCIFAFPEGGGRSLPRSLRAAVCRPSIWPRCECSLRRERRPRIAWQQPVRRRAAAHPVRAGRVRDGARVTGRGSSRAASGRRTAEAAA